MYYKFTDTDTEPKTLKAYTVLEKLQNGTKFKDLEDIEKGLFNELWHSETYNNGIIRQMGWIFDFRNLFKKYLVKCKYNGWKEQFAPNKTFIRENAINPSYILKIIELED